MAKRLSKFFSKGGSIILLILLLTHAVSCVQSPSKIRKDMVQPSTDSSGDGDGSGHGSTNPDTDGDIDQSDTDLDTSKSSVEIRWFVDPFDGTYQSKLTLPKNFEGILYLSVLNAPSLSDAFVDVRFNFGLNSSPITVPATAAKAINGGITPQTDVKVLVLNFSQAYFKDLKLLYDLFDYNDYGTDDAPTLDPRDVGLYCRGLRLENDPTFTKSGASGCNSSGDNCLYAYAKINDSTLYQSGVDLTPTSTQIDSVGDGYSSQSITYTKTKCLPDTADNATIQSMFAGGGSVNFSYGNTNISLGGETFTFLGPYYPSSASLWQITDGAVTGTKGIFKKRFDDAPTSLTDAYWWSKGGYRSLLFPLAGTRTLKKGVEYYGSDDPFAETRGFTQLSSDGDSKYMDGCNFRTLYRNDSTNDTIASCNVVASIEILAKRKNDDGTITQEVVAKSTDVKLQVIRASDTNYEGDEEIITSFKTCGSSNECGGDECCFNKRCWSKSIVSQCVEETDEFMTGENGATCGSDFQCQSLCCSTTGTCKEHKITDEGNVLCEKPAGQSCVAKEWCKPQSVQVCKVYKTGQTTIDGKPTCKVYCLPEKVFGDCVNGYCQTPTAPEPETIDEDTDCSNMPSLPSSS